MPLGLHTAKLNFNTIKEIGQAGKNSKVYLAKDLQLDGNIVIKQISKRSITDDKEFYRESKILYAAQHSNVVQVYYGCEDHDYIYIAMPYYQNGSLKDKIGSKFLTVREIIRYGIQFLAGVHHIHSKKLIHFDIKPDNIFLSKSNEALLADFGIAKAMNIYEEAEQPFIYNKQIPPEVLTKDPYTIAFDIYLCGLTLYKMCNGYDGFEKQFADLLAAKKYKEAILTGTFPNRNDYHFHIPSKLIKLINKAIAINPADRQSNALELLNDLASVDSFLDWQYSETNSTKKWTKSSPERTFIINATLNGSSYTVETKKIIVNSGKETKVSQFCNTKIISKELKKYIQAAFKALP
jgi:serine/threonine protein kinase